MLHITKRPNKNRRFKTHTGPPPNLGENALKWFEFADTDGSGFLYQEELLTAMYVSVKARPEQRMFIRKKIQGSWDKFDRNHDMVITKSEFMNTTNAMVPFLLKLQKECVGMSKNVKSSKVSRNDCNRRDPVGKSPPLSKGKAWFDYYDTSRDKALEKEEITKGLIESLKVQSCDEQDVIRDTVENSWYVFDVDRSGKIEKSEYLCEGGLLDYLLLLEQEWLERPNDRSTYDFLNIYVKGGHRHCLPPPGLSQDPEKWFNHVDYDRSKTLSQQEVTDSLFVTLNANTSEKRCEIREMVVGFWDKFDLNNDKVISKDEFLGEDGLANTLIMLEEIWRQKYNSPEEDSNAMVKIKVCIPRGKNAGDIMLVSSPQKHEYVVIQIPDKILWNGGGQEPHYIIVSF